MLLRLAVLVLIVATTLSACVNAAAPGTVPQMHYQLIIKFRSSVDDPAQADFVRQLSADADATLRFERTLAIGAQLYSVDAQDRAEFSQIVTRLSLRRDVLYVEEDRLVQPAAPN